MDKLTLGLLAHVDAGKTTLSEALLYRGGAIRRLGRVDHADAFLDTEEQERARGITIFSKQAVLPLSTLELTLLDTPGHVDFAAETERAIGAMDCALLVISGPDGPQGHTHTLWKLLARHHVPTFLFLNKMDQPGTVPEAVLEKLKAALSPDGFADFSQYGTEHFWEECALGDETALEEYMEAGKLSDATLRRLIGERKLFPCFFGSALKLEGVDELLSGLERFAPRPVWGETFSARVFKITHDPQGAKLTHLKLTGGSLKVKDLIEGEKVDQILLPSGAKSTPLGEATAGTVCTVTGLASSYPGQALGDEEPWAPPVLEPALRYRLILPEGADPHTLLPKLRQLEEEDPQLHLEWNEALGELHLRLMGPIQAEVLQRTIERRFGLRAEFGPGSVVYRETISSPVEGVGHFEPLRHYAEVHLLLEPLPPGSGIRAATACPRDDLAENWQRLILTHILEKSHAGVLTGSALTDVGITLLCGKAHEKHTEGGDFRQATYRAIRQGLMRGESVLLEPWYDLRLELPAADVGRALSDLQRMGAQVDPPETVGEEAVLTGAGPVEALRDYAAQVAAYTRGRGRLTCVAGGYRPCADPERVIAQMGYDPERDTDDPAGSVFCSHGAGHEVPWQEVPQYAHLPMLDLSPKAEQAPERPAPPRPRETPSGSLAADKELLSIFERTYGAVKPRSFEPPPRPRRRELDAAPVELDLSRANAPEYLLVDGYNMIFAWEELKRLAQENLNDARTALMEVLSNYRGYCDQRIILVFDAYKVPQGTGSVIQYHNIHVVYTKEAQTADAYIEKASYQLSREGARVRVATSDAAEQFIILGHGALRLSAQDLRAEVEQARGEMASLLKRNNLKLPSQNMKAAFQKAEAKDPPEPS